MSLLQFSFEGAVEEGGAQGPQSWVQATPALGLQTLQRIHGMLSPQSSFEIGNVFRVHLSHRIPFGPSE